METTLTAAEAHEKIERLAKENAIPEIRDGRGMQIGQGGRQGDIYVYRVPEDWPRGKQLETKQLAIGNTQGSRHIAAGHVDTFEGVKAPEFIKAVTVDGQRVPMPLGPCIVVKKEKATRKKGKSTVSHPEHAHFLLDPGTYQVVHQIDARTLERVKD